MKEKKRCECAYERELITRDEEKKLGRQSIITKKYEMLEYGKT